MSNGSELVTYDQNTKQLSSVPGAFAARNLSVVSIVWGVDAGDNVNPGMKVATIQWEDNSREPMTTSADCSGDVSSVNRNIVFENLYLEPSQWLLILS